MVFHVDLCSLPGQNVNVNLSKRVEAASGLENMSRKICVHPLFVRCRVSAAPGCLDHGGTAVQCGLFFIPPSLQAGDQFQVSANLHIWTTLSMRHLVLSSLSLKA